MFGLIPYTSNITRRNNRSFMNPFADEFFRSFFANEPAASFKVDVRDEGDHFLMEAELPGVKKEDVKVGIENGVITISANATTENEQKNDNYIYRERRYGTMQRAFTLDGINEDSITAEYTDGVLKLNLPKLTEAKPDRREITIE